MRGDIEMDHPARVMRQHRKHVQHLKADRRRSKEVHRHKALDVIVQESAPGFETAALRCRTMYLAKLVSLISMPSLSNSPWIWGAP
jgi:hypothetical protein